MTFAASASSSSRVPFTTPVTVVGVSLPRASAAASASVLSPDPLMTLPVRASEVSSAMVPVSALAVGTVSTIAMSRLSVVLASVMSVTTTAKLSVMSPPE